MIPLIIKYSRSKRRSDAHVTILSTHKRTYVPPTHLHD